MASPFLFLSGEANCHRLQDILYPAGEGRRALIVASVIQPDYGIAPLLEPQRP